MRLRIANPFSEASPAFLTILNPRPFLASLAMFGGSFLFPAGKNCGFELSSEKKLSGFSRWFVIVVEAGIGSSRWTVI